MQQQIIKDVENHVKSELNGLCSAHDFFHIERVLRLTREIYNQELRGNLFVMELGALLHESFDEKFYKKEDMLQRKELLRKFLKERGVSDCELTQVFFVIENVGFGKSLERGADFSMTPELEIVEDADRLDAIGAIAIARTFSYGGKYKRPIYDPDFPIVTLKSKQEYQKGSESSFHHFFEKLLRLKDLLHTSSAKQIAIPRHAFMEDFVKEFLKEWNGEG